MARNAGSVGDYFNVPTHRLVELGTRVDLTYIPRAMRAYAEWL